MLVETVNKTNSNNKILIRCLKSTNIKLDKVKLQPLTCVKIKTF